MRKIMALVAAVSLGAPQGAWAAIGCTLSNPAQDLKYLFPEMTSYKEELKEFHSLKNGKELFKNLKERLGSDLDPIYETYETPYTLYSVYKGKAKVGIVHGVNVPGKGGVIQVFLSTDPDSAAIRRFFFQRLESPAAKALREKTFRAQFEGMTLADFYKHDYYAAVEPGAQADKVGRIAPPKLDASGQPDYDASLRGIRKNLILLDLFVYGQRFEPFFEKAQKAMSAGKR
ncbi:MAG: hypothetical protein HY077_12845 [Elusimicrobia bacterium]|nr:hypothetical protein [Elusimicrobiota bacterium]